MSFLVPKRGIYESDASPGNRAWIVYIEGKRELRIEVREAEADEAITFAWRYLCAHDRHLRLLD